MRLAPRRFCLPATRCPRVVVLVKGGSYRLKSRQQRGQEGSKAHMSLVLSQPPSSCAFVALEFQVTTLSSDSNSVEVRAESPSARQK